MALGKLAFILEEFAVGGPGQQLLDRFLIGYPRDGEFRSRPTKEVAAWLAADPDSAAAASAVTALKARKRDFNLELAPDMGSALRGAEGVVIVAAERHPAIDESLVTSVCRSVGPGVPCFLHGTVGPTLADAQRVVQFVRRRGVPFASGNSISTVWRLPETAIEADGLREAVIVVPGSEPSPEWIGIEGLLPIISPPGSAGPALSKITRLDGRQVWRAADREIWPESLLAAALSRSNTIQGDPVRDGRTQDVAGLGLVRRLAREPRGWVLEHKNGLRSTILVLDEVLADMNFAVLGGDGVVRSAQLYRPVSRNGSAFDPLAGALEAFFVGRTPPWPAERGLTAAALMERVLAR